MTNRPVWPRRGWSHLAAVALLLLLGVLPGNAAASDCRPTHDQGNWAQGLADANPGDRVCLKNGDYPLSEPEQVIVPSGVTLQAQDRGQVRFFGGGREWGSILLMEGEGATVDGISFMRPTALAAYTCRVTGRGNRLLNSVCAHGNTEYKHGLPLAVGGSGHVIRGNVAFGNGRYVVLCFMGTDILFEDNIARWDGVAIELESEPHATYQNYACRDTTWRHNLSIDYGRPRQITMKLCGDFCIGSNEVDGREVTPDGVVLEGNVIFNHDKRSANSRAINLAQKGSKPTRGLVIRDTWVGRTRTGMGFGNFFVDVRVERCTLVDVDKPGWWADRPARCANDARVDFTWENESLAFAAMCDPRERQSGWCRSGKSLREYITGAR